MRVCLDGGVHCVAILFDSFCQPRYLLNPIERRMGMAGHQLVKADCSRFKPTNRVSQSHQGDIQ